LSPRQDEVVCRVMSGVRQLELYVRLAHLPGEGESTYGTTLAKFPGWKARLTALTAVDRTRVTGRG